MLGYEFVLSTEEMKFVGSIETQQYHGGITEGIVRSVTSLAYEISYMSQILSQGTLAVCIVPHYAGLSRPYASISCKVLLTSSLLPLWFWSLFISLLGGQRLFGA